MTCVLVKRLVHGDTLSLPGYQTPHAAGMDLMAALGEQVTMVLEPGARGLVATGLILEIPEGFEGQVRPRSGLALKHGVTVLNAPGTIDADYRGEVSVLLINHGKEPFEIYRGMRIAQLVIAPVTRAALLEIEVTTTTERGTGGYGSTGVSTEPKPMGRKP